ncbi:MAG: type I restriction enzyme HsdR N-terminal domain-containing protein [Bacteroidales bacterium]|jgi:hypothetical protein|nr:type I restriction enzyme HsdR N-terminal domain-containing protein [Bacteroidales bacterium]
MKANNTEKEQIFCIIRQKYVTNTPEECVRQNLLAYFINQMHYPQTLISVEAQIKVGKLNKRYDIVVYNKNLQPWLLVECKKNDVTLSQSTVAQILAYNLTVQASYLLITNGSKSYCFSLKSQQQLQTLPQHPNI